MRFLKITFINRKNTLKNVKNIPKKLQQIYTLQFNFDVQYLNLILDLLYVRTWVRRSE